MRIIVSLLIAVLLAIAATYAFARSGGRIEHAMQAPIRGDRENDIPARAPEGFAAADTIDFGNYQIIAGEYYAVQGGVWDFEDGADGPGQGGPSLQGWYVPDPTANPGAYWRHVTDVVWSDDTLNPAYAPLINGPGCLWVGLFESEARGLCWAGGLGYGNNWCQRLTSPVYTYTGSGSVNLSLKYWNDTEPHYDFCGILLQAGPDRITLNDRGFHGRIGFDASNEFPGGVNAANYERLITEAEFGGSGAARDFEIVLEFVSDGGWSDEDGFFVTEYGPWAMDDLELSGSISQAVAYDWDNGLQGWTATACPGVGASFFAFAPLSDYVIQDPHFCGLEGHIVHFHDAEYGHPDGQHETAWAPTVDRTGIPDYLNYTETFCDWDQYDESALGVFYRPGWSYYPHPCEATGGYGWSPRIGIGAFYSASGDPTCFPGRDVGTDWGLPADYEMVRFGMEIWVSCDVFGIPCDDDHVDGFTPLFDNFRIRMTGSDPTGQVPGGRDAGDLVNRVHQNHPNPFNPSTTISFSLAEAGPAHLAIYDAAGCRVRTLLDGHREAGSHSLVWDGMDDAGRPVASGVYWTRLASGDFSSGNRIVVLK